MLEEPAMFKPLSYSPEFVSTRQLLILTTDNASFQAKNIRAGSPDLFMSMIVMPEPAKSQSPLPGRCICDLSNRNEMILAIY